MEIGIDRVINMRDNKVAVICENEMAGDAFRKEVESRLGNLINIIPVKKVKPRIKVVGIYEELSKEELKTCILKQNNFINNNDMEDAIEVKGIYKRYQKWIAIVETDVTVFNAIIKRKVLNI